MSFLVGSEIALYSPSQDDDGNETSTLTDLVGSNDGTITGATWEEDTANGGTRALEFSNDHVTVPHSSDFAFGADPFWFSVWFKLTSTNQQMIVDKGYDTGNSTRFFLILLNSTTYRFLVGDSENALDFAASGYLNTWINIICRRSARNLFAHVGGTLAASSTSLPIATSVTNTDNLAIGTRSDQTAAFLAGRVDEVRFGAGQLSANDIAILSASRIPTSEPVDGLDCSLTPPVSDSPCSNVTKGCSQ